MIDQSSITHLAISICIVLILSIVTKNTLKLIIIASAICIFKELIDDKFDNFDLLFDAIGIAAGLIVVKLILYNNKQG